MRVKRVLAALLLFCAVTMSADAAAQTQMNVYFAANAMDEETAGALMELTRQAFPQAQWRAIGPTGERDLRALILGDDMPDLIVCAPFRGEPVGERRAVYRAGRLPDGCAAHQRARAGRLCAG